MIAAACIADMIAVAKGAHSFWLGFSEISRT
jgi:hypothetical protein